MADRIDTLVILGGGGDLAARLLMPGLGQLLDAERMTGFHLIGVGEDPLSEDDWRERVRTSFDSIGASGQYATDTAARSRYLQADVTDPEELRRVLGEVAGTPAIYFALPPAVTAKACRALTQVELPEGTVFGLDKPFGTDLKSAKALNRLLARLVPENAVHRVDHFMGKATVLNLLGVRFANRIFEPVWNSDNIASVDIVFDEQLGLEGRAGYYDKAGALADMLQSHLLIVLALFAMEPPSSVDADDLRGAMAQTLRATRVADGDARRFSRRARYTEGRIGDRMFPDYVDEPGVDPARKTETLAEVAVTIDSWRWAGVPFRLRSGKAIGASRKEIVVQFKDVPHLPIGFTGYDGATRMRILLSPEVIELDLNINGEADPFTLEQSTLRVEFGEGHLLPYGEVISGMLRGDPTLSVRSDVIEECWRIVEPVMKAWRADEVPLEEYPAGSEGP